jgi:hypothetical protein
VFQVTEFGWQGKIYSYRMRFAHSLPGSQKHYPQKRSVKAAFAVTHSQVLILMKYFSLTFK